MTSDTVTLPFTKQDFENLTNTKAELRALKDQFETGFKNTGDKLDEIAQGISACQTSCAGHRNAFADRMDAVEKEQETLRNQKAEEKGILKGRTADYALALSALNVLVMVIAIYSFFHGRL